MEINTALTPKQARFVLMLETSAPDLLHLFDFTIPDIIPEHVENCLALGSDNETILARFALSVWTTRDEFQFDIIQATAILNKQEMKIITHWLEDPFWP